CGRERGEVRLHGVVERARQVDGGKLLQVDLPPRRLFERAGVLDEDAFIEVDAHHLLEQQRVTPGEGARRLNELQRRAALAWREQRLHHGCRVRLRERGQLDERVARLADTGPVLVTGEERRPGGAEDED